MLVLNIEVLSRNPAAKHVANKRRPVIPDSEGEGEGARADGRAERASLFRRLALSQGLAPDCALRLGDRDK